MDEKVFQKRIKKITISVLVIITVLLAGVAVTAFVFDRLRADTVYSQIREEAEEYRMNVLRGLNSDLELLRTLAGMLDNGAAQDEGTADLTCEAADQDRFVTIEYYTRSGDGTLFRRSEGMDEEVSAQSLGDGFVSMLENAFDGEDAVSDTYYDETLGMNTYAYAVPVWDKDAVVGVLTAESGMETISDILEDVTMLSGQGHVHLIRLDGSFLIPFYRENNEIISSLYEIDDMDEGIRTGISSVIAGEQTGEGPFYYEGKDYSVYLESLNLNGWYLLCVNSMQGINASLYQMVVLMKVMAGVSLLVIGLLFFYGYRLIRMYDRELFLAACHDPLTGAYNLDKFTRMLARVLEHSGDGAVMALNIRKFKFINEIFGMEQGNRILCFIKKVVERHLAAEEFCCRDTADFFYVYLQGNSSSLLRQRAEEMIEEAVQMICGHDVGYQVQMYCGVTMISKADKETAGDIMTHTMFALAKAKETPSARIWFYDSEVHKQEQLENYLDSHMNQALLDGEFRLFLQPKMNLRNHSLGGAEALVRWVTGNGDTILPDQFVPIFERNGFCTRLDMYMTERVCIQIREWLDREIEPIPISINHSKLMFYEPDYIQKLNDLISLYRIPANLITLEILEGMAIGNIQEINNKILLLRKIGFRMSMDDFGSGYSSLNVLGNLTIDELKLDKRFLMEASDLYGERQRVVMEQIVELSKRLRISTVAEGVESAGQETYVQSLGCDFGQGYYYSRPLEAEEFNKRYIG